MSIPEGFTGPAGPPVQFGVGIIAPYDFALDRELWRWVPDFVSLHITRTPNVGKPVNLEMASEVSDDDDIRAAVGSLTVIEPRTIAYACTSGSFVHGLSGELHLRETIRSEGGAPAVTTSGGLLTALESLGVRRLGVATPYVPEVTEALHKFLAEADVETVSSQALGLDERIWTVPYTTTYRLIEQADHPEAEAIFVSCTNLATFDLIAPLEQRLGKPIITANQVTVWAALRDIGLSAKGADQRLIAQT